jgi:diguanylate cyclase (GGDEF)-like protein
MTERPEVPPIFLGEIPEEFRDEALRKYGIPQKGRAARFINKILFSSDSDGITNDLFLRSLFALRIAQDAENEALRQARLGMYDDITGLLNRTAFCREATPRLAELDPYETRRRLAPNSALLVNLDGKGQKEVNDTKGHAAGNINLRNIGNTILKVARPSDLVSRNGGDEFAALLFYRNDLVSPQEMKSRVDSNLFVFIKHAADEGEISGGKWVSGNWEPGQTIEELLHATDPIRSNPLLMEYPPQDILPDRR